MNQLALHRNILIRSSSLALIHPLLHLPLRLTNPLLVLSLPLSKLHPHNALQHLTSEPDKVMPPQRILEPPIRPLPLLSRQQVEVPKLPRPNAQIPRHSKKIEPDLRSVIPRDPPLQHIHDLGGKLVRQALPVADGRRLQPVQLVQHPVDGRIRNEVKRVLRLVVGPPRRLVHERTAPREAVVHIPYLLRVAQRLAAELGRQDHCELLEIPQLVAHVDEAGLGALRRRRVRLVQQHAEQCLCPARVLDRLRGEEDVLARLVVECAVERLVARPVGRVRGELEEKDDAVDGVEFG